MSTESVLNHHLEAFSAGDADAIMEDYTDNSVLIAQDATLTGKDQIRGLFESFFNGPFKPGTYEFGMDKVGISGPIAYIAWHSKNEGVEFKLGTDTILVENGKIAIQTLAAYTE